MNKFWSSPAWTMGHRYSAQSVKKERYIPGPGTYGLKSTEIITPSWKIGTGKRQKHKTENIPGPGSYQISKKNNAPKITFGMKSQLKEAEKNKYPGPGNYNPNIKVVYKNTQGPTLGSKYSQNIKEVNPGPGTYNSSYGILKNNPSVKIGTSKRGNFDKDFNPGPGTYQSNRPFSAGPQYRFGKSQKTKIVEQITPGPGQYQYINFLQTGKGINKEITLSWKNDLNNFQSKNTPGPGQYNLYQSRPSTAGIKIGTSNRQNKRDENTPGPGQYQIDYRQKYGPSTKIGSSLRKVATQSINPGPGSYNISNDNLHGPAITIIGNRFKKQSDQIPGPGTYQPQINAIKERPATAKIGSSLRSKLQGQEYPGPGHYTYFDQIKGPKFAFSRQLRGKQDKDRSPGPADYEIPSSIPNVPNYLMSSIESKSKY